MKFSKFVVKLFLVSGYLSIFGKKINFTLVENILKIQIINCFVG